MAAHASLGAPPKWMPHSSLSDFSRVKDIRVKASLGMVKNIRLSKQNLHQSFSVSAVTSNPPLRVESNPAILR